MVQHFAASRAGQEGLSMKYLAIISKTGNGYAADLPDLPGCIAAGETFEETCQLIQEAANFHVEGMIENGETIPEPLNAAVEVEVNAATLDPARQVAVERGR